jgi:acetyl-CoA acyltransferase
VDTGPAAPGDDCIGGRKPTRIMTTLVNALEPRGARYGLQTTCEGGGVANATIIERLG